VNVTIVTMIVVIFQGRNTHHSVPAVSGFYIVHTTK